MTAYAEAEILLQIDDVSNEYDGHLVLKKVCATIKDIKVAGEVKGQVVGFIGASGIGKSTLFRIMAGDIAAAAAVADHLWVMGRDHDPQGKVIPGAYIVETYNLIDRGLAWHGNIESNPAFAPFVQEVNEKFAEL